MFCFFFPRKYKIKIISACRTTELWARSLSWKRPEYYSKTIFLYFTKSVLKTLFERSVAFKLCICIFLKYPDNLTSVSFARPSSFSLLQIRLPVIWIHFLPLQREELSHRMTSRLERTGLALCLYVVTTNTKRKPEGRVLFFSWEEAEKEISNSFWV